MAEQELSLPPQPPKSSASSYHSKAAISYATKLSESDDTSLKLLKQVEYYFSDLNLATTDHLMRFISKDPEGFVPLSVVSSFKKTKALINGHRQLATILRNSLKLVVSEDAKKVRRLHPITELDMEELQSRIIVAENLPEDHSRQNLMKVFSAVGRVKAIRTCQSQAPNGWASSASSSVKFDNMRYRNKLHAFVEYESVELAEKAVAELNDKRNWRSGLRVRLMVKRMVGNRNKRSDNNSKKKKKKKMTTRNDDGDGGCLKYVTPLIRSKTGEKVDSISISERKSSKTPPIQASVSPEIQIQFPLGQLQLSLSSSSSSTAPGYCTYAAGHHVLSGITDKRKCRPRGLLAVAAAHENHSISNSHSDSIEDASLPLPLPSPTHASMHWLRLSPSDTSHHNDDSTFNSYSKSHLSTPPRPLSCSSNASPSSLCTLGTAATTTTTSGSSSGNVICTPASNSTSYSRTCIDDLLSLSTATTTATAATNTFTSQLDSVVKSLSMTTLSPIPSTNSTADDVQPLMDSANIDPSFQFETLTASYASTDLTHFRVLAENHNSYNSCCSSQSGMMISSRDMLMSEIYEMDELDCCRCLSDEEGHVDANKTCIEDILDHELGFEDKGQQRQEGFYPRSSCAESISTDGSYLLASSTDSDWPFIQQKQ